MNKHEFENEVRKNFSPEQQYLVGEALSAAWNYIGRPYGYYAQNVNDATQFIQRLMPLLARKDGKQSESTHTHSLLTPGVLLASDFLAEKITPWAEKVRVKLFGSQNAPFNKIEKTEEWIQEQERGHLLSSQGSNFRDAIDHLAQTYPDYSFSITIRPSQILEYLSGDGTLRKTAPQLYKSPLCSLAEETGEMERATGFFQPSLVLFVLTGIKPILLRYRTTTHRASDALTYITIEIKTRDLGFEELRKIYNSYREMLQLKKGKELTKSHWEIYRLVKEKGGPPKEKGKVAFWESVKMEWNELHPRDKYNTWKGVKITYDRIIARLESRLTTKGGTK